jgi:hypothetical protein
MVSQEEMDGPSAASGLKFKLMEKPENSGDFGSPVEHIPYDDQVPLPPVPAKLRIDYSRLQQQCVEHVPLAMDIAHHQQPGDVMDLFHCRGGRKQWNCQREWESGIMYDYRPFQGRNYSNGPLSVLDTDDLQLVSAMENIGTIGHCSRPG